MAKPHASENCLPAQDRVSPKPPVQKVSSTATGRDSPTVSQGWRIGKVYRNLQLSSYARSLVCERTSERL
ncbi:hypothetical protein [Desulfitobacterium sp.]|uniref:hypothetical protein n=1 Tax=Desulfitobacterium sp. TaxID=49981 RepID=UPI002B5C6A78|nr:hypothetical protein [Desulfitobacterium sp.]HVJ49459.1 hypothetical protein [Desulfitobacterium sp.]